MTIDISIINRNLQIVKIVGTIIGSAAIVAGVIWALVFIINLVVEGLRLLQTSWLEAGQLLQSMPALHFLFLLAIACIAFRIAGRMLRRAIYGR